MFAKIWCTKIHPSSIEAGSTDPKFLLMGSYVMLAIVLLLSYD